MKKSLTKVEKLKDPQVHSGGFGMTLEKMLVSRSNVGRFFSFVVVDFRMEILVLRMESFDIKYPISPDSSSTTCLSFSVSVA
jgi:hypothetical protein